MSLHRIWDQNTFPKTLRYFREANLNSLQQIGGGSLDFGRMQDDFKVVMEIWKCLRNSNAVAAVISSWTSNIVVAFVTRLRPKTRKTQHIDDSCFSAVVLREFTRSASCRREEQLDSETVCLHSYFVFGRGSLNLTTSVLSWIHSALFYAYCQGSCVTVTVFSSTLLARCDLPLTTCNNVYLSSTVAFLIPCKCIVLRVFY